MNKREVLFIIKKEESHLVRAVSNELKMDVFTLGSDSPSVVVFVPKDESYDTIVWCWASEDDEDKIQFSSRFFDLREICDAIEEEHGDEIMLRRNLCNAIEREDYENACVIRDIMNKNSL
jgi:hypothetical protein